MRELEKEFTKQGFKFRQIHSTNLGYVYEKQSSEGSISFEVFKRLENKKYNCISFPTDKAFGVWAWAYWNMETAINKLKTFSNEN